MLKHNENQHEYEFLPAVLEVQDSPPSPIGRLITWSVIILIIITVIWASVGQVDIVATAQGKIVTAGKSKTIQPLEIGVVKKIYVKEGQEVKKGDPLVALDTTNSGADKARLENELRLARLEIKRQTALTQTDFTNGTPTHTPDATNNQKDAHPADSAIQKNLLQSEISEYTHQLDALHNQKQEKEAELAAVGNLVTKLEKTLPLVSKRSASLKQLADQGLSSEQAYLEVEEQRISQQQDLAAQRHRQEQISASIDATNAQISALLAGINKNAWQRIAELTQTISALEKELQKTTKRHQLQRLTSPVDGIINQLEINTIGGVVTPAQPLMTIVSKNNALEVEAWVANKDIGFVEQGQAAEIKIEAFPFTKYGVIDAEILNLSYDAIPDEQLGLIYKAKVKLEKSVINIDDKLIDLVPGMNVTVEIKTGKRHLIEYVLSPIMQYQDESVRER